MTFQTVLLFGLAIFAIGLLLILLLGGSPQFRKPDMKKSSVPPPIPQEHSDTCFLLQKIDERRRITDEYHHTKICDEYFELVFELQNGEWLRISCSKNSYQKMPFRKTGLLTYRGGKFIRFKTPEQVISDEYQ